MLSKVVKAIRNVDSKELGTLVFFVTGQCNLSCSNCFYWDKLNKNDDMSVQELRNILFKLPRFDHVILSGGEPVMRKDLIMVVDDLVVLNKVKYFDLPTNGLLRDNLIEFINDFFYRYNNLFLKVSFSFDTIHNIPTIREVILLKNVFPNLSVQLNTVISKENLKNIIDMLDNLPEYDLDIDNHIFEIIRGNPKVKDNISFDSSDILYLKDLYGDIMKYHNNFWKKKGFGRIKRAMLMANQESLYEIQYNIFKQINSKFKNKWGFPCVAGTNIKVLEHDGVWKDCELRDKNDLQDCSCTHICFLYPSLYHNKKFVYWTLPKKIIKKIFEV